MLKRRRRDMFATEMKIITLHTTTNGTTFKNEQQHFSQEHHHQSHHTNQLNNSISPQIKSNSPKAKFVNGGHQISQAPQNNLQKFHNNSSNNHNSNNNKNSKKHHFNNNNNTSIGSLNRKKNYQHQQQQQQQSQRPGYEQQQQQLPCNSTNNNNDYLIKNQNVLKTLTADLILCTTTKEHPPVICSNNNSSINSNIASSINDSISFASYRNLKNGQHHSVSAAIPTTNPEAIAISAESAKLRAAAEADALSTELPNEYSTINSSSNCNSCWTNFSKLHQFSSAESKSAASSASENRSIDCNGSNPQEFVIRGKNNNSKKKASYWKNGNHNFGPESNIGGTTKNYLSTKAKQQLQHAIKTVVKAPSVHSSNNKHSFGNKTAVANTTNNNYQQQALLNKIAMTTALAAASATITTTTTASTANNSTIATTAGTTATLTTSIKKSTTDVKTAIEITSNTETATASVVTSSTATSARTTPTTASTSTSTSGPLSPNSYTLDFLHSVGVQMTSGANLAALKSSMGGSNMRSSATYSNHSGATPSTTRSTYNFPSVVGSQRQQQRYMSAGGVGSGSGQQHSHGHYQQHNQHHHHHHPQPQQLTIASFIQKDLLGESIVGGNDSGGTNSNSYDNQHQYLNQQRYHHNYYQSHYQQHQQPQPTQHQSYVAPNYGDNVSRIVGNGGNLSTRTHAYQNYHHSTGVTTHNQQQHHQSRSNTNTNNNNCNSNNVQHSQSQQLPGKKNTYTSSSASSCSSSSSSSSSASSGASSQASATSYRQPKANKTGSTLNLAIETLPAKSHLSSSHRAPHRLPHNHHHHHQQHHNHRHHLPQHGSTTPTTPQHQNFNNLTYVSTDGSKTQSNITMRSCSPSLTPSTTPSPKPDSPALVISINGFQQQQHNHYQNLQFHPQPILNNNNKLLAPQTLSMPPPQPPLTPTPPPPPAPTNIRCSQLDEVTTTAAAAAVVSSAVTGTPSAAAQTYAAIATIIAGNDYDSDSSSKQSSALPAVRRHKYQQLKPISLSSSSSASSTSSVAQEGNAGTSAQMNTQMLHSPIDFAYSVFPPPPLPTSQHYQQQFVNHHPQVTSPQQQQHYRNGVLSLLNLNPHNYTEEELSALQQQHTSHHFYLASSEHFNAGAVVTGMGGNAVAAGGYWSPLPNHQNFLYSQAPTHILTTASCGSSTTPLSPRLAERDEQPHSQLQPQQGHSSSNCSLNMVGDQLSLSQLKRSTSQLHTVLQQQQQRVVPSSSVSGANTTVAIGLRSRGRNQQVYQQQQSHPHHQQLPTPLPPPPPPLHPFQQHNLLCNSSQPHLRPSPSPSNTSAHDFFTHTPPDRFLARAHLIEAKEAPPALLNNSKWDTLSQDIWNKFVISQQTEETFKQKMRLWRYLYIIIKNAYPRYGLYLVGSTISGFGADTSDVDMCLVSRSTSTIDPRMEALFNLTVLCDCLSKSGEFENFNLIEAKVPILRFRDRVHQLEVDLNFNNCVGIKNTHLLYCYSQLDWRLRPLVLVIKLWAQYHNINNAKNMTISSYSLVLMVIHFLQYAVNPPVLPCLHDMFPEKFPLLRSNDFGYVDMNESLCPYESKSTQTIGELFLHFLEYYSCFNYSQFAISIRTGGLMPIDVCRQAKSLKNDIHQWKELCIEEPFDLTNTARSVYDFETFERVKAVFFGSWRILRETLNLNAIFSPIIIPTPTSAINKTGIYGNTITTAHTPNAFSEASTASVALTAGASLITMVTPLETANIAATAIVPMPRASLQETKSPRENDIHFMSTSNTNISSNIDNGNNNNNNKSANNNFSALIS